MAIHLYRIREPEPAHHPFEITPHHCALSVPEPLPASRRDVHEDLRTHGTKHMALGVPDVRSALASLKARGVEVAMVPLEVEGTAACYIRDNSGNLIELVEPFPV